MAALENPRHEMFAQHVASGVSRVEAYARVGYARSHAHASRLATLEPTRRRVAELQRRNIARQDEVIAVTTAELLDKTQAAYDLAMEVARPADALVAVITLAKLSGRWIENAAKNAKDNVVYHISDHPLSREEWHSSRFERPVPGDFGPHRR